MIYDEITRTIGNTPLVRLSRMDREANLVGEILLKLKFFNPVSGVKGRIGLALIESLERDGRINADNALDLVSGCEVALDGCSNFATRFLVNDACYFAKRPLISAAVGAFEG